MLWRISSLSPLLFTLLLVGCGHKSDPKTLMAEAAKLEQAGNYSGALIQLKNAAQAHAGDKDVRLRLGQLYLTLENYASAEKEFKRARQNGVDAAIVDPLIARSLLGLHDYQRLVEEIALPDKHGPAYPDLLAKRSQALIALGRKGEAEKLLFEAEADKLQTPDLYLTRASLALANRNLDEANQHLEASLKLDPRHLDTLLFKASLLQATGKPAEAEAIYKTVLTINPHHQNTRLALAKIAIGNNHLDEARRGVESVLKNTPKNLVAKYTLALIDFKEKKTTEARDQLVQVLKSAPNYLPAALLSGAVEYSLGNLESAQSQFLKVLKVNPNHVYARRMLAAAQLRLGQPDQAQESLAPLKPETSEDAGILIVAGEIALAKKQFSQAENFFSKASRINPENAAIRTELGLARLGQGENQGMADLESAAAQNQGGERAATLLVIAHLKRGEYDAAIKAATEMAKKHPESPIPPYFIANTYLGKNDLANARKNLELALTRSAVYFPAALSLAQIDLKEGQPKAAQGRFDKLLAADPKNIQAMVALAQLALQAGQENKYLEWLNKAAQTDAKAFSPRALIAQYYLSKRDFPKALATAREASAAQSDNSAALELLADTQLAAGETNNAVATYTKLADLKPESAPLRFRLGNAQIVAKQSNAAQTNLEKAIKLDPHFTQAQITLALLHTRAGRYDEALKVAHQINPGTPDDPTRQSLEGDIQMAAEQPALALATYEKALSKQVYGPLLVKRQSALIALNRAAEGDEKLTSWLKQHPDDHATRLQFADSLMSRNQYHPAAEHYRYLNDKNPNSLMILNNLAYALAQLKDKQAVQFAEQALKLAPDNPSALDTTGWALVQTGQPAKGMTYLQKALSKVPGTGDIQYHYATALAVSGDKIRAQKELVRLLDSGVAFSQEQGAQTLLKQLQGKTP